LYAGIAVQVHQTKYLIEIGFSSDRSRVGPGFVSLAGIPGQIALGTSPIVSAENGCGPSIAWASPSATWR
jgi:hypothetical protein